MRTEPGLVLEGRYELESLIATGGMGQVWKGRDLELDREVAVKVLREEYAGDEGFLKRFRAEARHTAALSHDAIAALYDYGELDGRAYIVMELCPGRPLSDIIEENTAGLPEHRVIQVLIHLARALDAAHAKGVVHRDVKPENILLDEAGDWSMKITDFGIARSSEQARLTKTGLVMGTAQYLSPEQAMGKQATSLSDIYALGIVAFEMLTGHRPFTGASQVDIAMAQVKQPPPELPETVNADLRHLVGMTLAKAPANRPRSAAAVARILEAISRGDTPRFTTGAIPTVGSGGRQTGGSETWQSAPSGGSPAASGSTDGAASPASPGASPTGTRTAAMPLPRTATRRGVRHRGSASAPSARSAPSATGSSPSSPPESARPTGDGDRAWQSAPRDPHQGAAQSPEHGSAAAEPSSRTVRGTSTGRRLGPFSVPGLLLILLLLAVVAAVALGATGVLTSSPLAPLDPDTMSAMVAADPARRTELL
ncbi:MAG: serine/threonine-protein kinase [Brachybacterium sp.]|nr:serine/threonine-protein kinase [Brachybacterium sp.]